MRKKDANLIIMLYIGTFIYICYRIIKWIFSLSALQWVSFISVVLGIVFIITMTRKKYKTEKLRKQEEERRIELERKGYLNQLRKMGWRPFEHYICNLFIQLGYDANVTKGTGDGGKDIIIHKKDYMAVVECKRYGERSKVTRPDIQKFHSAVLDCNAAEGFYITTGEFTKQARDYVLNKPIRLINGQQLVNIVQNITDKNFESFDGEKVIVEILGPSL